MTVMVATVSESAIWNPHRMPRDWAESGALFETPNANFVGTVRPGSEEFCGKIVIAGTRIRPPKQHITVRTLGDRTYIEVHPKDQWPEIKIELLRPADGSVPRVERFGIRPSEDSAEAGLLYTRVKALSVGRSLAIFDDKGKFIELGPIEAEPDEWLEISYLAKVLRKLSFLESLFGVRFQLDGEFVSNDLYPLEILYFGVTQGEAHTRGDEITVNNATVPRGDLRKPPFTAPGTFSQIVTDHIELLGAKIEVGPVKLILRNAELANKRWLDGAEPGRGAKLRFTVLDNQVTHRFESYFGKKGRDSKRRLSEFEENLRSAGEPEGLVSSIDESLQNDVQELEAIQVAMGWLYLKSFCDRYCAQSPELDQPSGHWRVPIHIVFADGQGRAVGHLVIDSKTAIVKDCTPPEVMRRRGEAIAKQIFHAEQSPAV